MSAEGGQTMKVVVLSDRARHAQGMLGQGNHSIRCELLPTRYGHACSGTIMDREIVDERTLAQFPPDVDRLNPHLRKPRGCRR